MLNMSKADHPETEGRSENMIKTLSSMLLSRLQRVPNAFGAALSQFEYKYNAPKHTSAGLSLFEIDIGWISHNPFCKCKVRCQSSADFVECHVVQYTIPRTTVHSTVKLCVRVLCLGFVK